MNDSNNGTDDTSPTFKSFEEGSETMSKEANTQLALRQEKFIRDFIYLARGNVISWWLNRCYCCSVFYK